jgi:hypothetical protein
MRDHLDRNRRSALGILPKHLIPVSYAHIRDEPVPFANFVACLKIDPIGFAAVDRFQEQRKETARDKHM